MERKHKEKLAEAFAARLEEIRRSQGLSVHAFANKCGIRDSLMRAYLNAQSLPGFENLTAIAQATGSSLDYLAGQTSEAKGVNLSLLTQVIQTTLEGGFGTVLSDKVPAYIYAVLANSASVFYQLASTAGPAGHPIALKEVQDLAEHLGLPTHLASVVENAVMRQSD